VTGAVFGGRNNSATTEIDSGLVGTATTDIESQTFQMANGFGSTKHRKSSAYKSQLICSATDFIHWSREIPIGDGFHEFF